jgi:acyl dehydratase
LSKELRAGDTFRHVRSCDKYRAQYYAGASGDFNPIHLDEAVAQAAGLGGTILHGMCTLAFCVEAAAIQLSDPGKITRVRVRFSRPVRPGDQVTFDGKVASVTDDKVVMEISCKNGRGEDVLKAAVVEAKAR